MGGLAYFRPERNSFQTERPLGDNKIVLFRQKGDPESATKHLKKSPPESKRGNNTTQRGETYGEIGPAAQQLMVHVRISTIEQGKSGAMATTVVGKEIKKNFL